MRMFLSGDEERAKQYIPFFQEKALEFKTRCQKAGLKQGAFSIILADVKIVTAFQYTFGELSVQIYAEPLAETAVEPKEKEITKVLPIWIQTHFDDVTGSDCGLMFSLKKLLSFDYENKTIERTDVTYNPVSSAPLAILCCPEKWLTINFTIDWVSKVYADDRTSYVCHYVNTDNSNTVLYVSSTGPFAEVLGYAGSCFTSNELGILSYSFGADFQYPDINTALKESSNLPMDGSQLYKISFVNTFWMSSYCWDTGVTTIIPQNPQLTWPYTGSWTTPATAGVGRYIVSEFTAYSFVGNLSFVMTDPIKTGGGDCSIICVYTSWSYCEGDFYIRIFNIDSIGRLTALDVPAAVRGEGGAYDQTTFSIFEKELSVVDPPYMEDVDGVTHYYYWHHNGPYLPSSVSAAPRNHLTFTFRCAGTYPYIDIDESLVFDEDDQVWKRCTNSATMCQLWDTRAKSGIHVSNLSGIGLFSRLYSLSYSFIDDNFTYNNVLTIYNTILNTGLVYGLAPMKTILHKSGRVLSIKGAANSSDDGIYLIDNGVTSKLCSYGTNEIEPVYISYDGTVVATKTAIYNNGTKIRDCIECCGVYFDHTHYVDRIESDLFVIVKIDDGTIIDSTDKGLYNFYEFSDDTSVCVISKYWMYEDDDRNTSYAIVVDFADPVYRFEISDIPILQYLDEEMFYPTTENNIYGYPGGIPFGARYNYICSCYCYNYTAGKLTGAQKHYIYTTPPNGMVAYDYTTVTLNNASLNVRCLHCNTYLGASSSKFIAGEMIRRQSRTVVAQYSDGSERRANSMYDGKRLNFYVYHHTGKILRRREPGLEPIPDYVVEKL